MTKQERRLARLLAILRRALISTLPVIATASACRNGPEVVAEAPRAVATTVALEALIDQARTGHPSTVADYQIPSEAQRAQLRVFAALAARGTPQEPPSAFKAYACGADRSIVTVQGTESGAGVYELRVGEASPLFVLVPHSFSDTGTLPIGEALFTGLHARALLVNTVHRYKGAGCTPPGNDEDAPTPKACPSDMAHADDSYFHALHAGLATAFPSAVTLALHGFARRADDPDLIVSAAGTRADLAPLLRELVTLYGADRVRCFPNQIQRLGGTTSVQARLLRKMNAQMVHLEMSREVRDQLSKDPAQRGLLVQALAKWLGAKPAAQLAPDARTTSCVEGRLPDGR